MTSELLKYLNEKMDVFLKTKQQKWGLLKTTNIFLTKAFLYNVIYYQILMLFKFLKISYVPL